MVFFLTREFRRSIEEISQEIKIVCNAIEEMTES